MIGDLDSLGHLILVILLLELYKGGGASKMNKIN